MLLRIIRVHQQLNVLVSVSLMFGHVVWQTWDYHVVAEFSFPACLGLYNVVVRGIVPKEAHRD